MEDLTVSYSSGTQCFGSIIPIPNLSSFLYLLQATEFLKTPELAHLTLNFCGLIAYFLTNMNLGELYTILTTSKALYDGIT